MKVAFFDTSKMEVNAVEIEDKLEDFYKLINCNTIDIVSRSVDGVVFDIVCDDEGLLKDEIVVSAMNHDFRAMLVGNLIFAHHDEEGGLVGLTDDEIDHIKRCTVFTGAVCPCEYVW